VLPGLPAGFRQVVYLLRSLWSLRGESVHPNLSAERHHRPQADTMPLTPVYLAIQHIGKIASLRLISGLCAQTENTAPCCIQDNRVACAVKCQHAITAECLRAAYRLQRIDAGTALVCLSGAGRRRVEIEAACDSFAQVEIAIRIHRNCSRTEAPFQLLRLG